MFTQLSLTPDPWTLVEDHRFDVRLASVDEERAAVVRLRSEVFGVAVDIDRFDEVCDHLLVRERSTGRVVGTYRMQTTRMAARGHGLYSATEFVTDVLPEHVRMQAAEVGRACVHEDFRHRRVLLLLWQGLAAYLERTGTRYLFGCCSLPTTSPLEAWQCERYLRHIGAWHPRWFVPAATGAVVPPVEFVADAPVTLPSLFRSYLRFGAWVCGGPVSDLDFGTTDFFVVLDRERLTADAQALFFRQ